MDIKGAPERLTEKGGSSHENHDTRNHEASQSYEHSHENPDGEKASYDEEPQCPCNHSSRQSHGRPQGT